MVVAGDYLYATGGYGGLLLDSVERARILPDGHLGEWELLDDRMTVARYINTAKRIGRRIYVLEGHKANVEGDTSVEWSYWDDEKGTGPWQESTPLDVGRYGPPAGERSGGWFAKVREQLMTNIGGECAIEAGLSRNP